MEVEQFKEKLKSCGYSAERTGYKQIKVKVNKERTNFVIYAQEEVKIFGKGRKFKQEVEVLFNKPQNKLSIFQAELLFFVFGLNKKPLDYAQYHKCKSGSEFIQNIKSFKVCDYGY